MFSTVSRATRYGDYGSSSFTNVAYERLLLEEDEIQGGGDENDDDDFDVGAGARRGGLPFFNLPLNMAPNV
ncbi:hypothetical protein V6N11_036333 [Hibiscus sabdariffa]|uniref:Uncharacterized protein n=1 Tax=Hibiscus sabdariffa TaxID=183260 RepID=A0ABR2RA45_9ROSI